jgi:hypothetical protein
MTRAGTRLLDWEGRLGEVFGRLFVRRAAGTALRTGAFLVDRAFTARRCFANPLASCGPLAPVSLPKGGLTGAKVTN